MAYPTPSAYQDALQFPATAFADPKPEGISELMYQIRNFHAFLWLSGGAFSDFLIHNIDECCWMKDAWPVEFDLGTVMDGETEEHIAEVAKVLGRYVDAAG